MKKRVVKKSVGSHYGSVQNRKAFNEAFDYIKDNPEKIYYATGNKSNFNAKAYIATKGNHKGEKTITFLKVGSKQVSAYAFESCWGKITNCYGTYIDCYTQEI